jgi:branched-chain amino acid transport system permease protein
VDVDFPTMVYLTLNGVSVGMLYFLVAAGLSLIFGLMHILNFAHGSFFTWGAYVGLMVWFQTESFVLALLAGALGGAVLGAVTEVLLIRPLYKRPVFQLLLTLGLALVLDESLKVIWGPDLQPPMIVPALNGTVDVLGQLFPTYRLVIIGLGVLVLGLLYLVLQKTRLGIIIRAGVQDRDMVQALGINVKQVFTLVFALGGALAGLGGIATVPFDGAYPALGGFYLLRAFVVVVIGGFGSFAGTASAALLIGVAEQLVGFYFPSFAYGLPAVLMAVILLLRPEGLFNLSGRRAS